MTLPFLPNWFVYSDYLLSVLTFLIFSMLNHILFIFLKRGAQCFHVLKCKLLESMDLSSRTFQSLEYSDSQTKDI